jgi:hypothetical protein
MDAQETGRRRKALAALALVYAAYSPFWAAVLLIDVELIKWTFRGYAPCCHLLSWVLVGSSFYIVARIAYETKIRVWQSASARAVINVVVPMICLLLGLFFFLLLAFPVLTYRFLD